MRILDFVLAVALGVWLGVLYAGGLWLTLRLCARIAKPATLLTASALGRVGGVLFCFHMMGQDGRWDRLCACVAGFFLMRRVLARLFVPDAEKEESIWQR